MNNKRDKITNKLKLKKVDYIINKLEELYPKTPIPLEHKDAYTLLVAVLLSAQSTDKRVNIYTPILFEKADNPYDMVKLSIEEIAQIIKPIGLFNNKSKAIWNLSKKLIRDFDGKVPDNIKDLESLPGVGHKTASVVVSQWFKTPAFPVDTHIHRMMKRWGLSCGKNVVQTEKDAKSVFPKQKWNKLHLQIIFYAREYSPARGWDMEKDVIFKEIMFY